MKRLLLSIFILFGILSMQSFAWNYGCGENIPPEVCGASPSYDSSYTRTVVTYGPFMFFAYDKTTGIYASANNYNKAEAKKEALDKCGSKNCKIIASGLPGQSPMGYAVLSSNGVLIGGAVNSDYS